MGFFNALKDLLGGDKCPACGTPGVRKSGSEIRCLNPLCQYFNPTLDSGSAPPQPPQQPQVRPAGWSSGAGPVTAPAGSVTIHYRNFQGQDKTFYAERSSIYRKQNHIRAKVAPKGQVITLSRDRIQNLREVEDQMQLQRVEHGQEWPSKKERQVLNYHIKHKSSSLLFEKIRAKYPKW